MLFPIPGRRQACHHLESLGEMAVILEASHSTPYSDGTTQVAFDPVDFVARLAALVPKPRVNLTRYHGVLAPNHRWRGLVTPARRGQGVKFTSNAEVRTPPRASCSKGLPRPHPGSPAPERTGNTDSAIAGVAEQSAAWDIAPFHREGLQPIASKEASENRMA